MRNVVLSMVTSLDGYVEGENGDISWHVWDGQMQDYMTDFLESVDTLLYGRVAYELMLEHWPAAENDASLSESDRTFARKMNNLRKVVFSKTLNNAEWNARLVRENVAEKVRELKQQLGKDMVLFAGADLANTFMAEDLIDEYRLIVNPVVLGSGKPLFKDITKHFTLIETRTFNCGNVLLVYKPHKENKQSVAK